MSAPQTRRWKVRYAKLVVMVFEFESTPDPENPDQPVLYPDDDDLPGVFSGAADGRPGSHVAEIQSYDGIWSVKLVEEGRPG